MTVNKVGGGEYGDMLPLIIYKQKQNFAITHLLHGSTLYANALYLSIVNQIMVTSSRHITYTSSLCIHTGASFYAMIYYYII